MFANERHKHILSRLKEAGTVTTGELVETLGVSIETVRRDLLQLERQGQLQRVHGGAVSSGPMKPYASLPQRLVANQEGKRELCRLAAQLVQEEDMICLDSGSTAIFLAQALADRFQRLTVVTHSLDVFDILRKKEGFRLILCGGMFDEGEKAFWGQLTLDTLAQLHVRRGFLFPSAVNLKSGIWDYEPRLMQVQRQIISCCDQVYVLADSEKFELTALHKLWDTDPCFIYVTDSGLPRQMCQHYREQGLTVITCQEHIRKEMVPNDENR